MKRNLGLRRTMLVMVLVPLLGATVFAIYQVRRLTQKAAELSRMAEVIAISVDIARFNILMGMEYTDSWQMFLNPDAGAAYNKHIEESEKLVARIRANLQRIDPSAYNKNFSANIDRALKIYEQIPAIRTYYLARRPGDDRESRKVNNRAYTDIA